MESSERLLAHIAAARELVQPFPVDHPCTVSVADQTVVCADARGAMNSRAEISKRAKNRRGKRKLAAFVKLRRQFFRGGGRASRFHEDFS